MTAVKYPPPVTKCKANYKTVLEPTVLDKAEEQPSFICKTDRHAQKHMGYQ